MAAAGWCSGLRAALGVACEAGCASFESADGIVVLELVAAGGDFAAVCWQRAARWIKPTAAAGTAAGAATGG